MEVHNGNPDYLAIFRNIPEDFDSHELGCQDIKGPIDSYIWRRYGYGSNLNCESNILSLQQEGVNDFTYFCSSTPWSDVKLFSETLKRAIYAFPDDVFTAILFVTPVAAVAFIFIDTITVQDVG